MQAAVTSSLRCVTYKFSFGFSSHLKTQIVLGMKWIKAKFFGKPKHFSLEPIFAPTGLIPLDSRIFLLFKKTRYVIDDRAIENTIFQTIIKI